MKKSEQRMLECFRQLKDEERETLMEYAEFLVARHGQRAADLREPEHRSAPENESVVAAIKRLSATYQMLDKGKMLNEVSSLMAQHIMQGRAASEVIAELEKVFAQRYEVYRQEAGQ